MSLSSHRVNSIVTLLSPGAASGRRRLGHPKFQVQSNGVYGCSGPRGDQEMARCPKFDTTPCLKYADGGGLSGNAHRTAPRHPHPNSANCLISTSIFPSPEFYLATLTVNRVWRTASALPVAVRWREASSDGDLVTRECDRRVSRLSELGTGNPPHSNVRLFVFWHPAKSPSFFTDLILNSAKT